MMTTTAMQEAVPAARRTGGSSFAARMLLFSVLSLALGVTVSIWMYFEGTRTLTQSRPGGPRLENQPLQVEQFDKAVLNVLIPTAIGGGGFLLAIGTGTFLLRRNWKKRHRIETDEWKKTVSGLRIQITEFETLSEGIKRSEAEKASLTYSNAQLQAELDQLKKAERTLLWRRQELESSKGVLELHVQERSEALQRLQEQYELILNSAGEGICGLDLSGRATFVNPAAARMIGWQVEELVGKSEDQIFTSPDPDVRQGIRNPGERIFTRKDGTLLPVECVKTPLNENGRVVGAVLIFKDITERKRVEEAIARKAEELARSNAELEQFAFVASHDLQEPLRKIQAFGDRLKTKVDGAVGAEARDYLERMQSASARMRTLINDLLTFSRVIRRTEPFVPVDLGQITKGVLGDLEVRIEKSGARVEVGQLPTVEADPMQMQQLLLNLLSNALKFQPPGAQPVVKVNSRHFTTLSGQQFCEVTVSDNGIGFEEKYLDKIFAVFQRLHGRNEYEGTGVGLAVCRRITDRHHGNINAKSQLGHGATFIVTLPLKQEKNEAVSLLFPDPHRPAAGSDDSSRSADSTTGDTDAALVGSLAGAEN